MGVMWRGVICVASHLGHFLDDVIPRLFLVVVIGVVHTGLQHILLFSLTLVTKVPPAL